MLPCLLLNAATRRSTKIIALKRRTKPTRGCRLVPTFAPSPANPPTVTAPICPRKASSAPKFRCTVRLGGGRSIPMLTFTTRIWTTASSSRGKLSEVNRIVTTGALLPTQNSKKVARALALVLASAPDSAEGWRPRPPRQERRRTPTSVGSLRSAFNTLVDARSLLSV